MAVNAAFQVIAETPWAYVSAWSAGIFYAIARLQEIEQ
jgi:hypothetical protein